MSVDSSQIDFRTSQNHDCISCCFTHYVCETSFFFLNFEVYSQYIDNIFYSNDRRHIVACAQRNGMPSKVDKKPECLKISYLHSRIKSISMLRYLEPFQAFICIGIQVHTIILFRKQKSSPHLRKNCTSTIMMQRYQNTF